MSQKIYGIDLGTTYSCIAHVDEHGKPVVVPNAEGELTTPSLVYFESPDNVVVGSTARETVEVYPDRCIATVKRAMGNATWERTIDGQTYTPQDVSSFILRKVVSDAEQLTGDEIRRVVITCPAYFGLNQKEATKQAGELAGLEVLYVIPEPTAAALAYGLEQEGGDQVVLVYDLGGGTFDVTLIEVQEARITVLSTGGDHELGGRNWDEAVASYFAQRFEEETGVAGDKLFEDPEIYQELLNTAERCKRNLTTRETVTESFRFEGERAKVELTRSTFDRITSHLLRRTLELTEHELEKAREKGHDGVDKLLLVGGSTYMPQVTSAVQERFGFEVQQYDPNQAVAKGAALFGHKCELEGEVKVHIARETGTSADEVDLGTADRSAVERAAKTVAQAHGYGLPGVEALLEKEVTNVTSKSFGVVVVDRKTGGEVVANLILANEPVPARVTQQFGTIEDGQSGVDIRCRESEITEEHAELDACEELGNAALKFERPLPAGAPVEITFDLGADGRLKLHGKDLTTGRTVETEFETDAIMSREEVEAARSRNLAIQVA